MSEEKRRGEEVEEGGGGGPGSAYSMFVIMEGVVEKLKLLDYQSKFCKDYNFKPFSRHYFALQTNSGEQFHAFTSLAAWLIQTCGKTIEPPQEFDDPNATISNILSELKTLGHSVNFPPAKLKSGCGEYCVDILNQLCDSALIQQNFSWKTPQYPEEEEDVEDNVMDDEAELDLAKVEEEMLGEQMADLDEEEESLLDLDGLKNKSDAAAAELSKPSTIMESNTSASEWKLEVERVTPQLKVTIRPDNKDWRQHVEVMHQHQGGITNALGDTHSQLERLHSEVSKTLDKIGTREKYLNGQLETYLNEFRSMQDRLAESKERYRQASGGVAERTRALSEVADELERTKQEMEERGSSMTDGAPLVRIKQALVALRKEMQQSDIRTGVLEHCLMQAKLKDKGTGFTKRIESSLSDE